MNEHGALSSYGAVLAGGGVTLWAAPLQTWLEIAVAALTALVLLVRLWVDIRRALGKRKEPHG